jgi:hypothetical protein
MTVLALDISGTPRQWISYDDAILYHASGRVAWSLGDIVAKYRGGVQKDGKLSYLETSSIIAIKGGGFNLTKHANVRLSNRTLFGRDRHVCAYCGTHFSNPYMLSKDHIVPKSKGGSNTWENCVTACKECNGKKSDKTLKEAKLELLYLPYAPNHFENMILQNRNILVDQMDFLISGVPKHSRVI